MSATLRIDKMKQYRVTDDLVIARDGESGWIVRNYYMGKKRRTWKDSFYGTLTAAANGCIEKLLPGSEHIADLEKHIKAAGDKIAAAISQGG